MENRLENIDSIVKDALRNIEFPYQAADWEAMESRIEKDAFLQTRLYWLKGGELLLMMLSFWVLFQFFGMTYPQPMPYMETPPQKLKTTPIPPPANTNHIVPPRKEDILRENEGEETEGEQKGIEEKETVELDFAEKTTPKVNVAPVVKTTIFPETVVQQDVEELLAALTTESEETIEEVPVIQQVASLSERRLPNKLVLLDNHNKVADFVANEIENDPVPNDRKYPLHFRIVASPDMNTAKSSSYRMGMTLGGFTSVELSDKWQIETGLAYSGKFLGELPIDEERFPNMAGVSKDANLHIAEIPLHLQYTIKKSTNWRPYVTAGATAHIAMFADYQYNNGYESPFDTQREAGALEGGRLADNVYATADIGLGLERQLGKNLHLFIQPTVKIALDDVGVHHDKIHTFSLVVGARTAL